MGCKFSPQLGFTVPESAVRNFKKEYLSKIKAGCNTFTAVIVSKPHGHPLLGPELDSL